MNLIRHNVLIYQTYLKYPSMIPSQTWPLNKSNPLVISQICNWTINMFNFGESWKRNRQKDFHFANCFFKYWRISVSSTLFLVKSIYTSYLTSTRPFYPHFVGHIMFWLVVLTSLKHMKVNGNDYPIYHGQNMFETTNQIMWKINFDDHLSLWSNRCLNIFFEFKQMYKSHWITTLPISRLVPQTPEASALKCQVSPAFAVHLEILSKNPRKQWLSMINHWLTTINHWLSTINQWLTTINHW